MWFLIKCIDSFIYLKLKSSSTFQLFFDKRLSFVASQSFFLSFLFTHYDKLLRNLLISMNCYLKEKLMTYCSPPVRLLLFHTSFSFFSLAFMHFYLPYFLMGCFFFQSFLVNLAPKLSKLFLQSCKYEDRRATR